MSSIQKLPAPIQSTAPDLDLDLIEPRKLAPALKMSLRKLQRLHDSRTGPPRITIGRSVYYRLSTVREWLARCEGFGVAQPAPRKSVSPSGRNQRHARRA
jgi:predicted DNA-binding transcriptional regulator AlpA